MGPLKALGSNGLNAHFFQRPWLLPQSMIWLVTFSKTQKKIKYVNNTLIMLIPIVENLVLIKDFHPISLYNVVHKIVTKVLATKLRGIMGHIISPN